MNKMMRAVETHIETTERIVEAWADSTKLLVKAGVPISMSREIAYSLIFSKELDRLCKEVLDAF